MTLSLDFETRSTANIKKQGMYRYAEDPATEIMCLAVKKDNEPTRVWLPQTFQYLFRFRDAGLPLISTSKLKQMLAEGHELEAHNAGFERAIWTHKMLPLGFDEVPIQRWSCTAARAAVCSLPRSLGMVCYVLGLSTQKDDEGYKIMMKMCKPRKPRKAEQAADPEWESKLWWHFDLEMFDALCRYCITDVEAEHALSAVLPPLTDKERRVWELDQTINDRGIHIDSKGIKKVRASLQEYERTLLSELQALTGGYIKTSGQIKRLREWLTLNKCEMKDMAKASVEEALTRTGLYPSVKRVLEIRQKTSLSSTAKLATMLGAAGWGDRVRGSMMYHGASTGRWTGSLIQPHNFPRGKLSHPEVEQAIDEFMRRGRVTVPHGEAGLDCQMAIASSCLRGMLTAAPGGELVCTDFSNIEGRACAWLAGEDWKLDAFSDYDMGTGPDLYKLAYSRSFNVPVENVSKDQRQIGKVQELALGYQGGIGAFASMAKVYKMDLEDLAQLVMKQETSQHEMRKAHEMAVDYLGEKVTDFFYEQEEEKMSLEAAVACDIIKQRWRKAHPEITQHWRGLQYCAVKCIEEKKPIAFGKVVLDMEGRFMTIQLPSGRKLYYCDAFVKDEIDKWGRPAKGLRYYGVDSQTKKWKRTAIYGGLLMENITQAVARDVLSDGMLRVEEAGYPTIMTVHDEGVAEVAFGTGSQEQFDQLMATSPDWAKGMPIAVAGWRGVRYRKD